jgi:cation transport regulator ChaC
LGQDISTNWIFGYGGLILPEGRTITLGAEVEAVPAVVSGYERYWGFQAPQYHLTTVALRLNNETTCAGVLFPVTPDQLARLDLREEGYDRVELSREQIRVLRPQAFVSQGAVYTYVAKTDGRPTAENPIAQSDVDAILTGCLKEHGEAVAKEIVRTTSGWESPWVNDRKAPRYPYSLHEDSFVEAIDQILREIVPAAFEQREEVSH